MATSSESEMTQGDVMAMTADLIKLLIPAFKDATKDEMERLKHNSKEVQRVLERLRRGEKPVWDYSQIPRSRRIRNTTGLDFDKNLCFTIEAVAFGRYPDSFDVSIVIPGVEVPLWKHKLSGHINWLGETCNKFVPLQSALTIKSPGEAITFRNKVQSSFIVERASILFFKAKEDVYGIHMELDGTDCWRTDYFQIEKLKPLLRVD